MEQDRVYTEKELSTVLKRASELQQEEGASAVPGLTLSELQHVANEAGIDPDFVRRAAAELDQDPPNRSERLFGGPTRLDIETMVVGKITGPKWDEALEAIRHSIGADGREILDGPAREWVHRDQMGGRIRVSMTPSGETTRTRVSYGMTEWLWLHFIMMCVGIAPVAVQYALLDLGALAETGIALTTLVAFYMIGWLAFRVFSRAQDRKMRKLVTRLNEIIADQETPRDTIESESGVQVSNLGELPLAEWTEPSYLNKSRTADKIRSA